MHFEGIANWAKLLQVGNQQCSKGGKVVLAESSGKNSESSFHTLCYHNQVDSLYAGKD